jgi:chromosome segregation protein
MRMKCLKLHGFKSFCKETDILFPDGTSAIVGPNGCGKSNVVDALRWVLGEQSPKRLRGKNMEEILFGGSEHFPPASMARVSLVLAQKDRGFPHPYSEFEELSIERVFYRGGESEYRINRMPVRLKDIIDLFSDTGTGTRAYSIIEQGYIGEIISAGPERRRIFIEEAAGIVKYKRRKTSALRKMEATEENLRHIEAIHFEIKRQMNALNRQAQKARRYQRLKEDIRRLDCTLAFRQHHAFVDQERAEQAIKGEGEQKAARLVAEFSREEAEIEAIRVDLVHENREMEEKKARLLGLVQELNQIENKQIYKRQSYQELQGKRAEDERQIADTRLRLEEAAREGSELTTKIDELSSRGKWVEANVGEERERCEAILTREKGLQTRIDSVKDNLFACMTKKAGLNNRQLVIQEKGKDLEQRKARGEDEIQAMEREDEVSSSRQRELEETLKGWKRKRGLSLLERVALEVHQRQLKGEFGTLSEAIERLQEDLNRKRSRLVSLQEFQENYEGFQEGVRAVMHKRKGEERLKKGIRGMVADVLETEPEYETALESVLGDKLQYIIVEEQEYGLQAIEYLKTQTLGRGSFIPLRLRAGAERDVYGGSVPGTPLIDVVKVKDEYQEIAEHLLGDVVMVPDLASGLDLWRNNGHFKRIVSKDGDLIDPEGVISGGKTDGSGNTFLKAKREIKELEKEVGRLEEEYRCKKEEADALLRKIRFNESDLERLQQDLYRLDMEILRGEKDAQQIADQRKRDLQRKAVLEAEASQRNLELEGLKTEAEQLAGDEKELEALQSSSEEMLSKLSRQIQELTAEKELAQDDLNRLEIELQVIWEKRSGLFTHKRQIEQRIHTINTYLLEKERDAEEALQKMRGLEKELKENEERITALEQTRTGAEEALAGINERVHTQTSSLERKEEVAKGLKGELERTRHELDALQVRLVALGLKKKNLEDQVWQRHRIDMTAEPELELAEEADEEIEQQLEKLYANLERIGEVNPTAIEEFESLQQRHQFYQTQFEDLKNSLESLKRLIQRINRITKTRFLEAFEQINAKFQKIFPQLFKGGKAFLQLDTPDDPLESGVDMVAQPPGKRLQNINLLSGGEKSLAALALLIAIFQYKPSPFCVLDEVDAALDDVNVMRFTELLRGISGLSQFILITHNKQTMEIASQLYGVTMESPGISQIVSVKVNESSS